MALVQPIFRARAVWPAPMLTPTMVSVAVLMPNSSGIMM